MVIMVSRTASDNYSYMAIIGVDQINNGVWYWGMSAGFILKIIVITVIAQRIEETSAKYTENVRRMWLGRQRHLCGPDYRLEVDICFYQKYQNQFILLISRSKNDGRNSQKLIVFIQGNAILGVPVISGTNQFLNLPTIIGTSIKKLL